MYLCFKSMTVTLSIKFCTDPKYKRTIIYHDFCLDKSVNRMGCIYSPKKAAFTLMFPL